MTSKKYMDLQTELDNEGMFITIISKDKLEVKTDQGKSIVTRKDVENFNVNIGSGYAQLGSIGGDWRMIQDIKDACEYVFDRIDKLEKR